MPIQDKENLESVLEVVAKKTRKPKRKGQKSIEYELNPNLTALELLEKVDLTDKKSIYEAAFTPKKPLMMKLPMLHLMIWIWNLLPKRNR